MPRKIPRLLPRPVADPLEHPDPILIEGFTFKLRPQDNGYGAADLLIMLPDQTLESVPLNEEEFFLFAHELGLMYGTENFRLALQQLRGKELRSLLQALPPLAEMEIA